MTTMQELAGERFVPVAWETRRSRLRRQAAPLGEVPPPQASHLHLARMLRDRFVTLCGLTVPVPRYEAQMVPHEIGHSGGCVSCAVEAAMHSTHELRAVERGDGIGYGCACGWRGVVVGSWARALEEHREHVVHACREMLGVSNDDELGAR